MFSFYLNSAKKKIVIGGPGGDILFPDDMQGVMLLMRKEFNFSSRQYMWALYPSGDGFMLDGKPLNKGDYFTDNNVISINDFSFSFSPEAQLSELPSGGGGTLLIDDEPLRSFHHVLFEFEGKIKRFSFREGREITVGRKHADVLLPYSEISGTHIRFVMTAAGLLFYAKGKNSTAVNGVIVKNGKIKEGKFVFTLAGKYTLSVTVATEKRTESFFVGQLAPLFEQIEQWVNQPEIFMNHPIILITGESGTGKEIFAEFTHRIASRKGELITFNTASIPENLVESELFGTTVGGFTDAKERDGAFIAADNGTLFLDEIAEMPVALQSKLLRVLEDWKVRKVGESGSGRKVNTMVVVATNHNLPDSVRQGLFRQDLYFRISTLHIKIPPLRERKDDIIPLAAHLHYALRAQDVSFTPEAERKLLEYDWPGNVRELKSVITRFAYSGRNTFTEEDCIFM